MGTEISTAILQAAIAATSQDRPNTHGDAESNFAAIAGLWNAYLVLVDGKVSSNLSALDVAQMMVLFKMARTVSGDPTVADHWVDQAGYTAVAARLAGAKMASVAVDLKKVLEKERTDPVQAEIQRGAEPVAPMGDKPVMPVRYTKRLTPEEAGLTPLPPIFGDALTVKQNPDVTMLNASADPAADALNT